MDAMKDLRAKLDQYAEVTGNQLDGLSLDELGDIHRFLRYAVAEVEEALAPKIVGGAGRGMTYLELASAAGYRSTTTITKIMREQGASPGRGNNPRR
jgi:hypothetical protein